MAGAFGRDKSRGPRGVPEGDLEWELRERYRGVRCEPTEQGGHQDPSAAGPFEDPDAQIEYA